MSPNCKCIRLSDAICMMFTTDQHAMTVDHRMLDKLISELMKYDGLPGLTVFAIQQASEYSGVFGIQSVETNRPVDALIKQLVFDPLEMNTSSFRWQDSFSENAAIGHGSDGTVEPKFKPGKANAAFSLHTTASDYGRFVLSAMDGALLEEGTAQLWMETQVPTPHDRFEDLGRPPTDTDFNVTWGLGWGIEPDSNSFFHWGANLGATAFVLGVPKERTAVVVFINSDAGLKFVPSIINHISPGPHPALTWLGLPDVK